MIGHRIIWIDLFAIAFGLGAWIAVNGVWVELPILVQELPESWDLSAYLSLDSQIANLGPVTYAFIRHFWPSLGQAPIIYPILSIGCVSSLLLALFWEKTTIVGGEEHSTALLSLFFCLAFVDTTSSVLYLPYMSQWKEKYFRSYLIGEGLSGLLPSLVALGQGVGGNADCINVTYVNETSGSVTWSIQEAEPDPRFSVDVFFYFLFGMMVLSSIGFILLEYLPFIQSERSSEECEKLTNDSAETEKPRKHMSRNSYFFLLGVQAWACFLKNGLLTSMQSYSCAPYGNVAYHLATTLSSLASPLVAFSTIFISRGNNIRIGVFAAVGTVIAGYIITTVAMSPEPPLMGTTGGSVSIVLTWVLWSVVIGYVRTEINNMMREIDSDHLYWTGVFTQLGSLLGSILGFILVVKMSLFTSYSPCY